MDNTKNTLKVISKDINDALAIVGQKYGYKFSTGTISYDGEGNFTTKLKAVKEGAKSPEAQRYESLVITRNKYGRKLLPLGAVFAYDVNEYIIIGCNTTGSKVHCKKDANGKTYLFSIELIETLSKGL